MSEPIKFCKDCRWLIKGRDDLLDAKCGHAEAVNTVSAQYEYLVDGIERQPEHFYCMTMRGAMCGPEAKLWEAKHRESTTSE